MKRKSISIFLLPIILVACSNKDDAGSLSGDVTATGDVIEVTAHSATVTSYAQPPTASGDVWMGVMFSLESEPTLDNAWPVYAYALDAKNMYTVTTSDLLSSTTYYYRSFIEYNNIYHVGKVKSFTTLKSEEDKAEEEYGPASVSVSPSSVNFDAADGSQSVTLLATRAWTASFDRDWVALSVDSGEASTKERDVTVSVLQNTTLVDRSAIITFSIDKAEAVLVVRQKAGSRN